MASEAPEGPSQPQLRSKEGEAACQEEGLNEVTVLVASVEAINTHKVVLQHLSPWQPRLPSSVDSESSAQRGGCQCICIWLRAHVCPCGCCERSHQCTGEGGGTPGGDPGAVSAAALAPVAPSLPSDQILSLAPSSSLSLPPLVFLPSSSPSLFHPCPALSLPLLLLAQSPPAGSPLSSPSFSLSISPRSVQVLKSLHVDKIIKYLTESFLSSFPEPLEIEFRASHRVVPHRADKMEFI